MSSRSVAGRSTGDVCTGYSHQSRAGADRTGKSPGAGAVGTSLGALTVCTIPLGSFWSFALLFLYTGFALVFFLFSQLLGLQVKANSVEFAGSFPIKASQDLTAVLLKGSTAPAQHRTNSARRLLQNAQLNVPASFPAGSQGSPNVTGMPCGNGSNSQWGGLGARLSGWC